MRINDLPDGILTNVATYLATPSVVLFAIAIQQDGSSSTQTSQAIMSTTTFTLNDDELQLQVLDFGDIEKSLAAKLTDDHISKILSCIDNASNNLRTLKLAGCVNITGSCLEVIRSSSVLVELDLSLVRMHESPVLDTEPLLSESIVIPILDDIIDSGSSSSLKLLHLPKKFRMNQSPMIRQFIERYDHYISSFRYSCSRCERLCNSTGSLPNGLCSTYDWSQNYTCCTCLAHYCFSRNCTDDVGNEYIQWCSNCERYYCKECVPSSKCWGCNNYFCNKCDTLDKVCDDGNCEANLCKSCTIRCSCRYCNETKCMRHSTNYTCDRDGCDKEICADCVESKGEGGECNTCYFEFCSSECRYHLDYESKHACTACMEESKSRGGQKEVIDEICQGMEDLYTRST